jgi:hypothetical protein
VRMLRLVNRFRRIRLLVVQVAVSLSSIVTVACVFFFCLGVAGLAGMQLFMCPVRPPMIDGKCDPPVFPPADDTTLPAPEGVPEAPEAAPEGVCPLYSNACAHHGDCPLFRNCAFGVRRNFNTTFRSLAALMFTVMDSSWVQLMYTSMRSYPTPGAAVAFYVVTYCAFMYGFFVLFISILLENFDTTDAEKEDIQRAALRIKVMKVLKGQQQRQIEHLRLRRDKIQWRRNIIMETERRRKEAEERELEAKKAKKGLARLLNIRKETGEAELEEGKRANFAKHVAQADGRKVIKRQV